MPNTIQNPYAYSTPGDLTTKGGIRSGLASQYGINSFLGTGTQNERNRETSSLLPGYESELNSGYSPQEKSGIEQGTLGGIQSSFGSATDAASRRMARTGNSAGFGSFLNASSRAKGQDLAQQELTNQKAFADEAQRRKEAGLAGLAGMFGVDTSFLNSINNNNLGVLGVGQSVQSGRRGALGNISAGLGLIGL